MRAYQTDDPAVLIMVGIKQQELEFAIRSACWRWDLLYDCRQDSIQPAACDVKAVMHYRQRRTAGMADQEVGVRHRNDSFCAAICHA